MSDFYDHSAQIQDSVSGKLKRILTSALTFFLFFVLSIVTLKYVTGMMLFFFGYQPEITYNRINNLPNDNPAAWDKKTITFAFSAAPILCLVMGIMLLSWLSSMQGIINKVRFVMLWSGIVFTNVFLSLLISAAIGTANWNSSLYDFFAPVFLWWRLKTVLLAPVSIVALIMTFMFGYFMCNEFLRFSFTSKINANKREKNKFVFQVFLIPVIIASVPVLLLSNEHSFPLHAIILLSYPVMFFGMLLRNETDVQPVRAKKEDVLNNIPVVELILSGLLWLAVYFLFK